MYLDSAYIAKFYVRERDSARVRQLMETADSRVCSMWAMAEVTCAFHRHLREGGLTPEAHDHLTQRFLGHIDSGVWRFQPITERLLRGMALRLKSLPAERLIRAGDALHLITAAELGEDEIWTSDRHLLAAAPHFGLTGRSA